MSSVYVIPILQIEKLRPRKFKKHREAHIAVCNGSEESALELQSQFSTVCGVFVT